MFELREKRLNMSLDLPTPEDFPAFPFSPPYAIQVDLMRHLYTSIEQKHVTIVESPTGTVRMPFDLSWGEVLIQHRT